MTPPETPSSAIPYWGAHLSQRVDHIQEVQGRDHDMLIEHRGDIQDLRDSDIRLERNQDKLSGAVNRLTMALVLFSLTLAGTAAGALLTFGAGR